jgi:general secretion pathway protein K
MIVALATTLAAFVAFGQQLWFRQMENVSDRARTDLLRRGAVAWAAATLADDAKRDNVDHLGEIWAQGLPELPVDGGTIRIRVEDAQGRFNLNNLWRGNSPSTADIGIFRRLLTHLRLDPELTEALVDWLDPDNQTRPQGAEDVEYLALDPPYRAANQLLISVDELRLVRGFSPEIVETLRPYLTALPVATDININTASAPVTAALIAGLGVSQAEQLLAGRERSPFRDVASFSQRLPAGLGPSSTGVGVNSRYFLVMLDTEIGRHRRLTEALVERQQDNKGIVTLWHRARPLAPARADNDNG